VKAKGQAALELAVLMLIVVPAFLYVLFADELNRHLLELQETVVSSPWDYAFLDYESSVPSGALNQLQQQAYANHSSSNPGGPGSQNQNATQADSSLTGPRWNKRIQCELSTSDGLSSNNRMISAVREKAQNGGKVSCSAQKSVVNYFLIQKFLSEWSQADGVGDELSLKGMSAQGSDGNDASRWPLAEQSFAIVTDTWALKEVRRVEPDKLQRACGPSLSLSSFSLGGAISTVGTWLGGGGEQSHFYDRMHAVFCRADERQQAVAQANKIVDEANDRSWLQSHLKNDSLVNLGNIWSFGGDNTNSPTLAFFPQSDGEPGGHLEFNSSPWEDGGGNNYKAARDQRRNSYMGEKLP
jgi:hypothetical protein